MKRLLMLAMAAFAISACSNDSPAGPSAVSGGYYAAAGRTDYGIYLYGDPATATGGSYFVRRDSAGAVKFDFGRYDVSASAITFTPGGAGLAGVRKVTAATWSPRPTTLSATDERLGALTLQHVGEFWPEASR